VKILKVAGFNRIFQAECFPDEIINMFGKNLGEMRRYLKWLNIWLHYLDDNGMGALNLEQFEHIQGTDNPHIYSMRHPHSAINERYLYIYIKDQSAVLLTVFMEKDAKDYTAAIKRAQSIYKELE